MRMPRAVPVMIALLAIAILVTPALAKTEHFRGCLVRTTVDGDAKGKIDLESKTRKGETEVKLRLQAQNLPGTVTSVDFVLFEENDEPDDDDTTLVAGVALEDGAAVMTLRTKDEDTIDGGAATFASIVDDLDGALVGVLDQNGDVILFGTVPGDVKGNKKDRTKSKVFGLDEKARVSLEWKARKDRIRLLIKTKQAAFAENDVVTFLLVWDDDDETFVLGTATVNDEGQAKLELRTDHGDPLPLEFLDDHAGLGGLTVKIVIDTNGNDEVDDGETVATGALPGF